MTFTSGYPRLCRLVPAESTGGLYPTRPLLRRLSLATRPAGSIGGLYPGRLLLRRPLPGPYALFTLVIHRSPAASSTSPSPTPHAGPGRLGPRGNTKPASQAPKKEKIGCTNYISSLPQCLLEIFIMGQYPFITGWIPIVL
jgi:hypothetical protein